jgi:hypothetical protein
MRLAAVGPAGAVTGFVVVRAIVEAWRVGGTFPRERLAVVWAVGAQVGGARAPGWRLVVVGCGRRVSRPGLGAR